MTPARGARGGLTLVETLVAVAVLGMVLAGLSVLLASCLRVERAAAIRRELAARAGAEIRFQRSRPSAACAAQPVSGPGWTCTTRHACLAGVEPCPVRTVVVEVAAPDGAALVVVSAVAPALNAAPVAGAAGGVP